MEAAETGSHDSATAQVADDFARIGAIDHGQASDILAEHFRGRFRDQFVGVSDHESRASGLLNRHRSGRIFVERTEQIAASDDARQFSDVVEDQQSLMASYGGIVLRDALG